MEAVAILEAIPGIEGARGAAQYIDRHTFELQTIVDRKGTDISLWDIGGGLGAFPLAATRMGMQATLVDDFYDLRDTQDDVLSTLTEHGVRIMRSSLPAPIEFDDGIDVITSIHVMEHLHHSPRTLYARAVSALAPGGLFILAGPNAVNLRKRITMPFGVYEWSSMEHWYEEDVFRAHVREPRVQDFEYIARDLGLRPEIIGQNFLGKGRRGIRRILAEKVGPLLEMRPSLCSDLYLIGHRT